MKNAALVFVLMFAGIAFGQAPPSAVPKIAVLDTDRLSDRTRGISKLAAIYQETCCIDSEFVMGGSSRMKQQIADVENEIAKLKCSNSSISEKETQLADLKRQYSKAEAVDRATYQLRYSQVMAPMIEQIRSLLKAYSAKAGIGIIVDKVYLDSILVGNPKDYLDITDDFIAYCNKAFADKK
jgi:Skp family chaperone for outer membrane proteins